MASRSEEVTIRVVSPCLAEIAANESVSVTDVPDPLKRSAVARVLVGLGLGDGAGEGVGETVGEGVGDGVGEGFRRALRSVPESGLAAFAAGRLSGAPGSEELQLATSKPIPTNPSAISFRMVFTSR